MTLREPCATCALIPDSLRCYNARESLPESTRVLTTLGVGGSDADLWQCPQCSGLFVYRSETAQSGSGNNDEDTLDRLPRDLALALLRRDEAVNKTVEQVCWRVSQIVLALGYPHRGLVLALLRSKDPELAAAVLPALVRAYAGNTPGVTFHDLDAFTSSHPARLLELLDERMRVLDYLAGLCREKLSRPERA